MNELRPPTVQAAGRAAFAAPGWNLLVIAAARCWLALALLALAAGVCWRLNGFAPPLLSLFDGIGVALWLAALLLEPAWDQLQMMQSRHFAPSPAARHRHYAIAAGVAAIGVPLSMAALGALPAYDTRIHVALILTLSQLNIPVTAGAFSLIVLLVAGPSLICLSLAILSAGRAWLGRALGTVVWAACLFVLNAGLLWSDGETGGLSLGRLAEVIRDRLNIVNLDPTKGLYVSDLLVELLLLPAAALALCIVLLAWSSIRPWPARVQPRLQPGWLAALGALTAVGVAAWLNAGSWSADSGINSPGSWDGPLCIGATALIIGFALLRWSGNSDGASPRGFSQLLWGLAVVPAWAAYTLPNVFAGQITQELVLSLLAATAFICALFLVVTEATDRLLAGLPAWRFPAHLVVIALAAVPVDPEYGPVVTLLIRQLRHAIIFPEYRELAAPMAGVLMLIIACGVWQIAKRPAPAGPRRVPKRG